MRDRENAGLRGPVKNCVEEIVHPTGTIFLAYEYAADGRLLALRQTNPDGSVSVTSHDYDADGRLTKIVSGNVSDPGTVWLYTYNENGKVTEPTDVEGKVIRTNYHRDLQGRKIAVKSFSSKVLEQYRGGVGTDSFWHAAESGIGVPDEGSVVTVYDDRDLPIEMRILDKKGRSLTRFIRTYDANGRMLEERQILENPALGMVERLSAEQGSEFDETRLEAMNKAMSLMMAGKNGTGKWHRYDAQGRLVEVRDRNFAVETVTTTSYNEHGNISEVRTTRTDNLAFAAGVQYSIDENGVLAPTGPVPDQPTLPKVVFETDITEYRYEYDEYDNWTRETTVRRFGANEHSAVRRHVLTYY
jgi:YD repeat-containing protein